MATWQFTDTVNLIQACSALAVAGVAVWGINAWRREQLGKRRAELAEDVLALFYEAERAMHSIRSFLGHTDEGKTRTRSENESEQVAKILDDAYVIIERYNAHAELFSKIRAMHFRFMALFGRDAARPFEELREIENDLFSAAKRYAVFGRRLLEMDGRKAKSADAYLAGMKESQAVFWEDSHDPDPINRKLEALIATIEDTC